MLTNGLSWEFALSQKSDLTQVSVEDLNAEFARANDPNGPRIFGTNWNGITLRVRPGQIVLAWLASEPLMFHAIQIIREETLSLPYDSVTGLRAWAQYISFEQKAKQNN